MTIRDDARAPTDRGRAVDFQLLFQSVPGSFLVLDPSFTIVAASDSYLADTMTVREQLVGKNIFDAFPDNPDDPGATGVSNLRASLERVRSRRQPDAMAVQKYDIPRPTGGFEVRYWSPLNSPVIGADKTLHYIIHRVLDVTDYVELKLVESEKDRRNATLEQRSEQMAAEIYRRSQQLQEANRQLRAASVAKSDFLSRMSHELRSPLTAILGFGELLTRSNLPDDEREWSGLVLRAGRHLLALINDILDISRIESGNLTVSMEPVAVTPLLHDVCDLTRGLAEAKEIKLSSDPGLSGGVYVLADSQRLRQVLLNLVSNAIKYNRDGGSVTINVEQPDDEHVRIAIVDTGDGLSADELGRLFTPFDRLHAEQSNIEGTGLGLSLSRDLLKNMNGTISVESDKGVGSTFAVTLPLIEPAAVEESRITYDEVIESRSYAAPRTVLYVEDMVANVRLIEQILKRRPDVTLMPAMLGSVALDLAREHQPDVILLDLHLPDLSGDQVLRRLRDDERTADTPVVILSADATRHQQGVLEALGVAAYLTKPIEVKRLLEVLDDELA